MKSKIVVNYLMLLLSFAIMFICLIKGEWALFVICAVLFGYMTSNAVMQTIDYLEYKNTERAVLEYFLANREKLLEKYKESEFEYIFRENKNDDK